MTGPGLEDTPRVGFLFPELCSGTLGARAPSPAAGTRALRASEEPAAGVLACAQSRAPLYLPARNLRLPERQAECPVSMAGIHTLRVAGEQHHTPARGGVG